MNVEHEAGWAGVKFVEQPPLATLTTAIEFYATGWQGMLERPLTVDIQSLTEEPIDVTVMPIRLQSKLPKTIGFAFPEAHDFFPPEEPPTPTNSNHPLRIGPADAQASNEQPGKSKRKWTRIKPPTDLVKLEDRLYFVLQPPLE